MPKNERIKVGVTGHGGFIGTNLLSLLKDDRVELCLFQGDLLNQEDIERFFANNPHITQLIHLVGSFGNNLDELIRTNVMTLYNLLSCAVTHDVKKVILTSTGAVYGEPVGSESYETDPLQPNTPYGLAKLFAEQTVLYYANNFDLNYVILRFPNVYGRANQKGVIFNLLSDAKTKGEVTIYGDGEQSRNFLNVEDACQAIERSIFYGKSNIFNISNPHKVSINMLLPLLAKKYKFKVAYRPANNHLKDLLLNIDKAKSELGFQPTHQEVEFE